MTERKQKIVLKKIIGTTTPEVEVEWVGKPTSCATEKTSTKESLGDKLERTTKRQQCRGRRSPNRQANCSRHSLGSPLREEYRTQHGKDESDRCHWEHKLVRQVMMHDVTRHVRERSRCASVISEVVQYPLRGCRYVLIHCSPAIGSCLYQTVGWGTIAFIARTQAPDVPFYHKVIDGTTSACFVMGGRIGAHASHQTFTILPLLRPLPKSRPLTTPSNAVRVRNLAGQPHYGIRMENNSFGPIQRLQIPHHIQTTVRTPCKVWTTE